MSIDSLLSGDELIEAVEKEKEVEKNKRLKIKTRKFIYNSRKINLNSIFSYVILYNRVKSINRYFIKTCYLKEGDFKEWN